MADDLNFDLELNGYDRSNDSFFVRAARVPGLGEQKRPQQVAISKLFRERLPALAFRTLSRAELVELGIEIGNALLPAGDADLNSVRGLFIRARDRLQPGQRLRLRLKINEVEDFELTTLPWEFALLRDTNTPLNQTQLSDFLALDQRVSLVRSEVLTGVPLQQYSQNNAPIGMLVLLISPQNAARFPTLDLAPEQTAIQSVIDRLGSRVQAKILKGVPGDSGLQKLFLDNKGTQILHFAGHGYFAREMGDQIGQIVGQGGLVLADTSGEARLVPVETLAATLRGRDLRLVVLAACEGAQRDAVNAWSGVAPALIRAGIPAVVGMQFSISNANASVFSDLFYTALMHGSDIDDALYEARLAMSQADDDALQVEFGFPALYLRLADEQRALVLFPETQSTANGHTTPERPDKPANPRGDDKLTAEPIRLDVAAPEKATVGQTFDLAVAIRQPGSPELKLEDLPKTRSAEGTVFRAEGQTLIKYRVDISAPGCDIADASIQFLLEQGKDSAVQYFQLTPRQAGRISIVVSAYQDDDLLAATTRTQVLAEIEIQPQNQGAIEPTVKPTVEPTVEPTKPKTDMPDKVTLRNFIATNFNLRQGDFDLLCENLTEKYKSKGVKVSMDDISGNTAPLAALNLIGYMERRGWLPYLVEEVRAERPDVPL